MRTGRWLVHGSLAICAACSTGRVAGPGRVESTPPRPVVLQVPYVAQSVLLCGGAAIAMIERWWGRRSVYAEDFAGLVRRDEGGIRTSDLARTMQARGWTVEASAATPELLQRSLADSVPVIALIRVSARRYHYVVILALRDGRITYHDPAVAPFMTSDTAAFMARWRGAQRWALFVRPTKQSVASAAHPPGGTASSPAPLPLAATDSLPCRPWLDRAADAAAAQRLEDADALLSNASRECAAEPLVLRELAGLRFRQGRHTDAVRLVEDYLRRAPGDSLGWLLLASSRYLRGDAPGALTAWNRVGTPVVDLVRIDGTAQTRFRGLTEAIGITPSSTLTPGALALASRRLSDVPSLSRVRVAYAPVDGSAVEVRAVVVERPVIEPWRQLLLNGAIDAGIRRDASVSLYSPLRFGEQWTAQWRWQQADPRVALTLAIPARVGIPAIVRLHRNWETYRFSAASVEQERSVSAASIAGWATSRIEGLAAGRMERWSGDKEFFALTAGIGLHDDHDRAAFLAEGERAVGLGTGASYGRVRVRTAWIPPADRWRNAWSYRLGADWSAAGTPLALQPIAGGDLARDIPLRAHPFIVGNRLPSRRTAGMIVHGGVAADRDVTRRGRAMLGVGVFVDAARLASIADGSPGARSYVDVGAGVRVGLAGSSWTALRIDLARGLTTNRRWGINAGLAPRWPVRLGRSRDGR